MHAYPCQQAGPFVRCKPSGVGVGYHHRVCVQSSVWIRCQAGKPELFEWELLAAWLALYHCSTCCTVVVPADGRTVHWQCQYLIGCVSVLPGSVVAVYAGVSGCSCTVTYYMMLNATGSEHVQSKDELVVLNPELGPKPG